MVSSKKFYKRAVTAASLLALALAPVLTFGAAPAYAASSPAYRFTKTFDSTSGGSNARGTTTDAAGNVYVTGDWNGTVTFDGVGGSDTRTSSNTSAFVAKYSPTGQCLWTKAFDTSAASSNAYGFGVAVDVLGNVFVTGQWQGTVTFDGVGGSDSQTTAGSFDTFLTKFNADGSYGWTKTFDATSGSSNGAGVVTDGAGNVYFDGYWNSTVVFDGPGGSDSRTSANSSVFLTKYNANGTYGWTKTFDVAAGADGANASGLAIDKKGNLYLAGFWSSTTTFDGVGGFDTRTSANDNAYITKLSASGAYDWTRTFDASTSGAAASAYSVAVDDTSNVYIAGSWLKQVMFDGVGGTDTKLTNNASNNPSGFLTKYDANGNYQWTQVPDVSAAADSMVENNGIALDGVGNVYVGGVWAGTVTFGGSNTSTSSDNSGLLTSYTTSGTYNWTKVTDASAALSMASNNAIALDAKSGNLYIAGQYVGPVTFDGPGGSDTQNTATLGNGGAFLTSYHVFDPVAPTASGPTLTNTGYNAALVSALSAVLLALSLATRYSFRRNRL